MNKSVELHF